MTEELIVYVDKNGQPNGETAPKLAAHNEKTQLHLAFSCYVFNEQSELLVTQRVPSKKVWPGVWSGTACGHPAPNEPIEDAITRRLDFELGMKAKDFSTLLPNYTYKTPPFNGIVEHEFCPVFAARLVIRPKPNPEEVSNFYWTSWGKFLEETGRLDLRKMLPLSELGTDELKILLSPGSVSVDTLTGEKEFLTVRDSSGDVVVLRKSSKDPNNVWSWWCKDQVRLLRNNKMLKDFLEKS